MRGISLRRSPLNGLAIACLAGAVLASANVRAQGPDELGLWFDTAFTQHTLEIDTFPALIPAYLVLHDPSATAGTDGWECRLQVLGPATLVGTLLEGNAINIETAPAYRVGVLDGPLPGGDTVLLATFQLLVTEAGPVSLSLLPLFDAVLPDEMAYQIADGSQQMLPMGPVTGMDLAAWINATLDPVCEPLPAFLYYQDTPTHHTNKMTVTVHNRGVVPLELDVSIPPSCDDFQLVHPSENEFTVAPYTSVEIDIYFLADETGYHECELDLGTSCPGVPLYGTAYDLPVSWEAPTELDFGTIPVNTERAVTWQVTNTGEDVFVVQQLLPFDCTQYWVSYTFIIVYPGETRSRTVYFTPTEPGLHACTMGLGATLPPIELSGRAYEPAYHCTVEPALLDFGAVDLGTHRILEFTVTNRDTLPIAINPVASHEFFSVEPGPIVIPPGEEQLLPVAFRPMYEGSLEAVIDLGLTSCAKVTCIGEGVAPEGWDENVVGFVFDEGAMAADRFEFATTVFGPVIVPAYLVLVHPSIDAPLAGWECRAGIVGPASYTSWELYDSPINVLPEPQFMVGLGTPRPPARSHLLATAQVFVEQAEADIVLTLDPVFQPSLPEAMAWLSGGEEPQLMPMRTITRESAAAFINSERGVWVGITAARPVAELSGNLVMVSWTRPRGGDFDGCRVLRRVGAGEPEEIGSGLVPLDGDVISFVDEPRDLPSGSVLHYSYALISDGREVARSPEVEITLQGLPTLATRLLPNVPNPFNPQTEIRFELAEAGPARVTIYDVTGRVVRTLVNETVSAGPQTRIWNGTDDAGQRVSSGAYHVRLETDGRIDHRKILLLK